MISEAKPRSIFLMVMCIDGMADGLRLEQQYIICKFEILRRWQVDMYFMLVNCELSAK